MKSRSSLADRISAPRALVLTASVAALFLSPAPSAHAQAANVNGVYGPTTSGGSWIVGSNWDTNPFYPDAAGASATIPSTQTVNRTISLNDAITLGALTFTNNTTFTNTLANGVAVAPATGPSLEFDSPTDLATITSAGTGTNQNTISATMILTDSVLATVSNTLGNVTAGALTLSGAMSGPGGFTKDGVGLLTISTNLKTYLGPTLLAPDSGRTRISASGSITQSSSFTASPGTQIALTASTGNPNYTLGLVLNLNGDGPTSGPHAAFKGAIRNDTNLVAVISTPAVLQSDTLIHVQGATGSTTLSGGVSGPGALTLTAPNSDANLGTLSLTGSGSFAGGTTVRGGTLELHVNTTLGTSGSLGSGDVTVLSADTFFPGASARLTIQTGVLNGISDLAVLSLAGGRTPGLADDGFAVLASGVNELVGGLVLGGAPQPQGIYGSTAANAANPAVIINDEYFSGPGTVTVVPEPGAAMMLLGGFGALLGFQRARRRN